MSRFCQKNYQKCTLSFLRVLSFNKIMSLNLDHPWPKTLDWPAYSPDLNPIENVWSWLKNQINDEYPRTIASVKKYAKKHWNRITPDFVYNYYNSMSYRVSKCLELNGSETNY